MYNGTARHIDYSLMQSKTPPNAAQNNCRAGKRNCTPVSMASEMPSGAGAAAAVPRRGSWLAGPAAASSSPAAARGSQPLKLLPAANRSGRPSAAAACCCRASGSLRSCGGGSCCCCRAGCRSSCGRGPAELAAAASTERHGGCAPVLRLSIARATALQFIAGPCSPVPASCAAASLPLCECSGNAAECGRPGIGAPPVSLVAAATESTEGAGSWPCCAAPGAPAAGASVGAAPAGPGVASAKLLAQRCGGRRHLRCKAEQLAVLTSWRTS